MLQVLQDLKKGNTYLEEVPTPSVRRGHVLIQTSSSLISAGTERMLVEFGKGNLIAKAKSQPEKVAQVIDKIKTDGLLPTMDAVFAKLNEPIPLGYCNVGKVVEVGAGVVEFAPGDRVASNGSHAEYVSVPVNLCAKIPDEVSDEKAAFTVLSAISLQGIRLAKPTIGETVYVAGLGLIGLILIQLLKANGCQVIGGDFQPDRLKLARSLGCRTVDLAAGGDPVKTVMSETNGRGADAVIITASTKSSEPVSQAARMSRKRGRIVLIGVTGLELNRSEFYEKELSFQVSCSYGAGRYDPEYEEKGNDYPIGYVRWTEKRNFETILELLKSGNLQVEKLITDRIDFDQASVAYAKLTEDKNSLGIVLNYSEKDYQKLKSQVKPKFRPLASPGTFGIIGAGNFTTRMILPALNNINQLPQIISSSGGRSAAIAASKFNIPESSTNSQDIFDNPNIDTIFITTRHDSHADLVVKALNQGKHVFVEKPLAIDHDGIDAIKEAYLAHGGKYQVMVGFNRRFSPHIRAIKKSVMARSGPLCMNYVVNAGAIPKEVWIQDPFTGGGRIIGEGCHFIDILRFLAGSPIVNYSAAQVNGASDGVDSDKKSILLTFADGSIGTVHYWANGSKAYPKETLEVFMDEAIIRMDNFRQTKAWGLKNFKTIKTMKQDKGHQNQFKRFLYGIKTGKRPLIPFKEIEEVSRVSIEVAGKNFISGSL